MEILYSFLVFLHFVTLAGIISGWLMQQLGAYAKAPKVLLHSALTQLVLGLLLALTADMLTPLPLFTAGGQQPQRVLRLPRPGPRR